MDRIMIFVAFLIICIICCLSTSRSLHIPMKDLQEVPKIPRELIELVTVGTSAALINSFGSY